jgi:PA14 domain
VLAARWGVLGVVVVGMAAASCVNLSYPPGATRDGGGAIVAHIGNGHVCALDTDCQSGNCDDGVCCKTDCNVKCFSCALPGNEGVCMPAPIGMNPRMSCSDEGAATCGQTGVCDGAGSCQKYAAGTVCKEAGCVSAHFDMLASRCTADGQCVGLQQKCAPYLCDTGSKCLTTCTLDTDCENGIKCMAGSCGKKALGTACGDGTECDSTFCAQGVCCAVACAGGCLSCALPGSEGACTPVIAGANPADPTACATTDASTCGLDGTCDGAGACRNFPAGTTCSTASCSSATLRAAGTCDGKSHCQIPAPATCGGYTCVTATACRTVCAADADCASPSVCGTGACGGLSAQYFRQTNLTDLAFSRTDPAINFNWGGGSPSPLLNVDNFSVRWRGKITARFTDMYTFYAATDDGERLIIGGTTLIDHFIRHSTIPEDTATIFMTAGKPVDIVLEYFESGGDASAMLSWSSSMNEPKAVIPTSAFAPQ